MRTRWSLGAREQLGDLADVVLGVWGGCYIFFIKTYSKNYSINTNKSLEATATKVGELALAEGYLSIPCSFTLMKQSDIWLESYNRRQAILQHHESLSRTAMQLSMELQSMKAVVENMGPSAQKMKDAQLVQELVKLGCKSVVSGRRKDGEDADSGALTVNLLQSAQQVSKHILSNPACVAVLLELENDFGTRSPFHRMGALACIAKKPSSPAMREWCLHCVRGALSFGGAQPGHITQNSLQGDKRHAGLVALYELKWKVP